jgi:hypothetical protein
VTSQGSPTARFDRAIKTRNLFLAEVALREMRSPPPLPMALDYLALLADVRPDRVGRAAVRWHGRLELETTTLSLAESQLALAALASLCAGDAEGAEVLRRLLRRVRPTVIS